MWLIATHHISSLLGGGSTRMARGGIRLVYGLTKSTLITYFSGMKVNLKYAFLHAFFLIYLSCPFQNLSIWPKTRPFFPVLHFFGPLNDVRAYIAWSWKTTLITWIFGRVWYPPWHSSSPGLLLNFQLFADFPSIFCGVFLGFFLILFIYFFTAKSPSLALKKLSQLMLLERVKNPSPIQNNNPFSPIYRFYVRNIFSPSRRTSPWGPKARNEPR